MTSPVTTCIACTGPLDEDAVAFCKVCSTPDIPHTKCASCEDCGRQYGDETGFPDLIIPNAVWRSISPYADERGLLCPCCIGKRVARQGWRNVPAYFMSGPFRIASEDEERQRILREWTT